MLEKEERGWRRERERRIRKRKLAEKGLEK